MIADAGRADTGAPYTRFFNANTAKYFLQSGFTLGREGKVGLDFSLRYSLLRFAGARHNYKASELEHFNIRQSAEGRMLFLRETALTLSIPVPHTDWLCLETAFNSASLSQTNSNRQLNFSIGFTADSRKAAKPTKQNGR